jgi:hypothetical protein
MLRSTGGKYLRRGANVSDMFRTGQDASSSDRHAFRNPGYYLHWQKALVYELVIGRKYNEDDLLEQAIGVCSFQKSLDLFNLK